MSDLDFIPYRGTESSLKMQVPQLGVIGFATDTGRIFLDVKDETTNEIVHKSIGGNGAAIFYATASLEELPNGWVRFSREQLNNEENVVNENDLIINSDGKFLKVIDNTDVDFIICEVIAVSGTGGGGGATTPTGTAKIEYADGTNQSMTILMGDSCILKYNLIANDAAGDEILNAGEATWAVSNVAKYTEQVYVGANSFDIGPYLSYGTQQVTLKIVIDTGGDVPTTVRKTWNITVTELRMTWESALDKKYTANQDTTISWMSYGSSLDKTAYIIVDQIYKYSQNIGTISNSSSEFTIPGAVLNHGAHEIELYLSANLNDKELTTESIKHQLLFVDDTNTTPIIVVNQLPKRMNQYDTLNIQYVAYDTTKVGLKTEVIYYENDIQVGDPKEIDNGTIFEWSYTPATEGYRKLTIACGVTKYNIDLEVDKIDLGNIIEVPGYAFKLKASEFGDNSSLRAWNSNGVSLSFSDNFDWVNGGLKSEEYGDEKTRTYIKVRAGNTMTINYQPFKNNITTDRGKCIKVIFKVTQCRDYDAEVIKSCIYDTSNNLQRGFIVGAQSMVFKSQNSTLEVPYCEDTYIELEIDITTKGTYNYITSWIDGVPANLLTFTNSDNFDYQDYITIGSQDADVYIYSFKVYEKHLTDTEHLSNFIMDAPNAVEMIERFRRNDILDSRGEIDPKLLAEKNPNCRVHCYEIPYMSTSKDIKVDNCNYIQYHGSSNAVLTANKVRTRVQGTSSVAYGAAAFNIDADFRGGFDYPDGSHTDKWAMDDNAIPVKYFTTKVNVASCENANNALNQKWYNDFQPYQSPNRIINPKARDCMQFYPGVLFILDHNQKTDSDNAVDNNVFKDTEGYIDKPYFKLYSICNMGNSKKNVEVFHDTTNPLECCIEVADNQQSIQRMTECCGLDIYNDENIYVPLEKLFDDNGTDILIEYDIKDKDGNLIETRTKTAYELWRNVNMSKAGFEFRYPDGFGDNDGESFEEKYPEQARQALIGWFEFVKWMSDCNPAAATDQELETPVTYGSYTFKGNGFSDTLKGTVVSTYNGTYTRDTEKYRMAKMLNECEDHLVMDSVMFHMLFIERHTMIDNVTKNTFWSSSDAKHWNLAKNYDNDTSDGNDNQGKLSLKYGLEPGDINEISGDSIFNAPGTVWLEFARRLARDTDVGGVMFRELEAKGAWSAEDYCNEFDNWQSVIPERCWIEAYYRLYKRPFEVYNDNRFISMLDGGKKTYQRKQYETYQEMYISSKYFGTVCSNAQLLIRPKADNVSGYSFPLSVYADCYIKASVGQGTGVGSINYTRKIRRNETVDFISPTDDVTNATMYLYPGSFYQEIGDENSNNNLSVYRADQLGFANAKKLRKLVLGAMGSDGSYIQNPYLQGESISFQGNTLLEELYIVGYEAATSDLDLSQCPNLKVLDSRKSGFTGYVFPNGAPITTTRIEKPTSIQASNLNIVSTFEIENYSNMQNLKLVNIDESPGLNSLILLKNSKNNTTSTIFAYNLQQVLWNETDPSVIIDKKINYLDWLLDKTPQDNDGNLLESKEALTGELIIPSTVYNESDSYDIYNYYCCDTYEDNINGTAKTFQRFPNLDIIFEGENALMPKITILNQADQVFWSKRIANNNTGITEEFYTSGPNGKFIPFTTTSDISNIYEFANKYEINGEIVDASANGYPVYNTSVTEDIVIKPIFNIQVRQYTVTVKGPEGETILEEQYDYDTMLSEVVKDILPPFKNSSSLGFFYTYQFAGYKIDANEAISSLEDLEKVPLRSDRTLTTEYKEVHVYQNPLDLRYFDLSTFNSETDALQTKDGIVLSDKITIPRQISKVDSSGNVEYINVKKLATGFLQNGFHSKNTQNITHIFFEPEEFKNATNFTPNQTLNEIGQYALSAGTTQVELPVNITSVVISGINGHWMGSSNSNVIIVSDQMTQIPQNMFAGYNGKVIRRDAIGIDSDKTINWLLVNYIGENAFNYTGAFSDRELIFGKKIEFAGKLETNTNNGCDSIIFYGNDAGDLYFTAGATITEGEKIWEAKAITLQNETTDSSAYNFVTTYFSYNTLTTTS